MDRNYGVCWSHTMTHILLLIIVCQDDNHGNFKNLENREFHEISEIFGIFSGQKFYYETCHYIKMTIKL